MANTKTPLGLNQWELDEKLKMADFNADNQIVDEKLRALDETVGTMDTRLDNKIDVVDTRLEDKIDSVHDAHIAKESEIDARLDTMDNSLTYTATASYQDGTFLLSSLPQDLPTVYTVRFFAPADYTYGDSLNIGGTVYNISTLDGNAPLTGAFKAGVVVSMDVHGAGGRAFFKQGGGSASGYGILPSQTQIDVTPGDAQAQVTLSNPGGEAFAGTKLVCKQGGDMPQTQTDGAVFDAAQNTSYTITGLANDTVHTVRAFAYNHDGEVQTDINGAVKAVRPSEYALAHLPVGSLVNITVNGITRPFLVVHQGQPSAMYDESFAGGTILLMKDIYESRQWHNSNANDYANSTIHSYLNNDFFALVDAKVRSAIKQVKVPYRPGSGTSTAVNSGTNGLPAYVWLLGGYEVNWTSATDRYFAVDGATMTYFAKTAVVDLKRSSKLNGTAAFWWLRTPYTSSATYAWSIRPDGSNSNGICSGLQGIRPAFVLPDTTPVDPNPNPDGSYELML